MHFVLQTKLLRIHLHYDFSKLYLLFWVCKILLILICNILYFYYVYCQYIIHCWTVYLISHSKSIYFYNIFIIQTKFYWYYYKQNLFSILMFVFVQLLLLIGAKKLRFSVANLLIFDWSDWNFGLNISESGRRTHTDCICFDGGLVSHTEVHNKFYSNGLWCLLFIQINTFKNFL